VSSQGDGIGSAFGDINLLNSGDIFSLQFAIAATAAVDITNSGIIISRDAIAVQSGTTATIFNSGEIIGEFGVQSGGDMVLRNEGLIASTSNISEGAVTSLGDTTITNGGVVNY